MPDDDHKKKPNVIVHNDISQVIQLRGGGEYRNSRYYSYPLGNKNKSKLIETANIVQNVSGLAYEKIWLPPQVLRILLVCVCTLNHKRIILCFYSF